MEAVRGLSIGYSVDDFSYNKDGARVLKAIDLWEVSVVSMPMNPLATIQHVKSRLSAAGEYVPTVKEFERILRNAGCSNSVAKTISYRLRNLEDEDAEGVMPEAPRKAETGEAEQALKDIADRIMAEAIGRKLAL
jgi:hypothetical protein